jgi:monoamine oxidase
LTPDAIVIGAGAAGLAAARELLASGAEVAVLEARERAGGRMYTLSDPRSVVPIELGAEFVHGTPAVELALLRETGAARIDTGGTHAEIRNGALVEEEDDTEIEHDLQKLLRHAGELDADVSVEAFLARYARGGENANAAAWMRAMVEGFDAADPARASMRAIAEEWNGDAGIGGASSRPVGGYGPLVDHLLRCVGSDRVLFGTTVRSIEWGPGGVRVRGERAGEAFEAQAPACIVTLPLGVLLSGDVTFDPPLPPERRAAIEMLEMGAVYKAVLVFTEPVWERAYDGRLMESAFFHAEGAEFPTMWTSLPMRSATLVAWAGGPHAAAMKARNEQEIYESVLRSLDTVLGKGARDAVRTIYMHDWQHDPYALGAYSYVKVGGMGARERLAAPLPPLYFAGEAAALHGEAGTVGGALQTGVRAARELSRRP